MKVLVTGANGFVGKNLISQLNNIKYGKDKSYDISPDLEIFEYDIDTDESLLYKYCENCDFVFNLAGVNRPINNDEFMQGNFGFASTLLDNLKRHNNKCPIMISSSIQAALDNPYGKSKKAGEDL
ncbi:MAG: NAD-dependent epimerase/dehydratase family protein, partial [Oscillospiraceae bacterium]